MTTLLVGLSNIVSAHSNIKYAHCTLNCTPNKHGTTKSTRNSSTPAINCSEWSATRCFISLAEPFNIPPKSKQVTFELHVIVKQTLTENVKILQFDVYNNKGKLLDIKSI